MVLGWFKALAMRDSLSEPRCISIPHPLNQHGKQLDCLGRAPSVSTQRWHRGGELAAKLAKLQAGHAAGLSEMSRSLCKTTATQRAKRSRLRGHSSSQSLEPHSARRVGGRCKRGSMTY